MYCSLLSRLASFVAKAEKKVDSLQNGSLARLLDAGAQSSDEAAVTIITRSQHLRESKAKKSLKKKAFSDLLHYLRDLGIVCLVPHCHELSFMSHRLLHTAFLP